MVRRIRQEDRDAFLLLSAQFYASPAVLHALPAHWHAEAFEELLRSDAYAVGYMLAEDGKDVGFGLLAKTYSREAGGMVLWLEELFILEEYRGKGLGKEFFAEAERYARENGFARIRLEVEPQNVRARALYERLGYVSLDYVQMVKELRAD